MKLLEGMRGLEDALSLATDEPTIGLTAARSIAQSFHLSAATALFVDPSVAILEPIGSAGQATAHPVVNGPTSCPAIRGGRLFRVTSAEDPVVCPFMPYRSNYACIPLVAAGDSVGALFLEPDADSIVEETLVRAAADRVALTLATRRVGARVVAERLRATVEAHGRAEPRSAITVRAGVATWRSGRSAEQVLQAADSMLYAAKRAGKDRVMVEAPAAA